MKNIFIVMTCFILLSACCPRDFDTSMKKVYVDRVFMNEPSRYTFITKTESENNVWSISSGFQDFHLYSDVPKDERMYVEYCKKCSRSTEFFSKVYIHVHELGDVEGGGWNHGKFGSGQTVVIE